MSENPNESQNQEISSNYPLHIKVGIKACELIGLALKLDQNGSYKIITLSYDIDGRRIPELDNTESIDEDYAEIHTSGLLLENGDTFVTKIQQATGHIYSLRHLYSPWPNSNDDLIATFRETGPDGSNIYHVNLKLTNLIIHQGMDFSTMDIPSFLNVSLDTDEGDYDEENY